MTATTTATTATTTNAAPRVAEDLNGALRALFDDDPHLYLLGEDIADPYGGAFKVTKGLTGEHPERVLATPLSEGAIVGMAGGLALCGESAIAEIMFGDFATLCFDPLVNFAAKSVSMYGHRVPMRLVVRCPVGGNRGYGPTHSQSPQKHFIGVPGLSLFEMSPLHDNHTVLTHMLSLGEPCVFFEDKTLYARRMVTGRAVDDLFEVRYLGGAGRWAEVGVAGEEGGDCLLIAAGGMVHRALGAMRELLLEDEICCRLLVPSRLHPFDTGPPVAAFTDGAHIAVVEEGAAGGTWGSEVAARLHDELWGRLRRPVGLVSSRDSVIPAAPHLERQVLVQQDTIRDAVRRAVR
ncbi:alpha-ketoacid dehydrogenase subunit beta [Streptomyces sp. SID8382]|uniref:alpha-ketoacid dehydrogenase subunit beta n=1 Tax=Streptomyces TaxID=1883 RepID=UPI000853C696|nr:MULTISPECIES: transketolase C-terminal domain-containing protein [unclassified Streptomyces]MCQ6245579.1 alpha-ketoacid dehydrogenase subunit beta [Streptomyces malaysiensis]AUA16310.1 2-oxoisovalerate dehydrogenase subunit beta [Streptomyces sp. M56]MCD9587288.1 alpha-ketoacid dehydrogenase subunit beta [Streptomyces sp. 8ZJF_21]MCM3804520.1 alpha-ketoacid dehydrogenase subunit beta [Streptomyces sp. DR7-3]MYX62329.1 alpha-ketoacid dehydrogenase subunit beta [Streptomyces sp. SID8382]